MMNRTCSNYNDNELLFSHLKSTSQAVANKAWECLRRCAGSVVKSSKWRIFFNDEVTDEDILQDAITKLWVSIKDGKYDDFHRRNHAFCALLKMTFRNLCIDTYRKQKKFSQVELTEIENAKPYLPDFLNVIIQKEEIERIQNALQGLSPKRKQAYEMYVFQGYKIEEIAQEMNIERKEVSYLIWEAKRNLIK